MTAIRVTESSGSIGVLQISDGTGGFSPSNLLFNTASSGIAKSFLLGSDVAVFVSGATDSRGTSLAGSTLFGGDVIISGTLYGGSPLKLGGEVEFITSDGETTDLKNPSGSVKMFGRDEVKIGSGDGLIRLIDLGGSTAGKIFLTGSSTNTNRRLKFLSKGQIHLHGANPNAVSPGSNVFLFVSGAIDSHKTLRRGVALFGGDVVISGTLYAEKQVVEVDEVATGHLTVSGTISTESGISGSLTRLSNGKSFIEQSGAVTVSSASGGAITIASPSYVSSEYLGMSNGSNTKFTFNYQPDNVKNVSVFVNGIFQAPATSITSAGYQDYSVTGSSMYFTTGSLPESGSVVFANYTTNSSIS